MIDTSPAQRPYAEGVAFLELRDHLSEAEAAFRLGLSADPDHVGCLLQLGITLRVQGRLKESSAMLKRALRLSPNDPLVHMQLGTLLRAQKKMKAALNFYGRSPPPAIAKITITQRLVDFSKIWAQPRGCKMLKNINPIIFASFLIGLPSFTQTRIIQPQCLAYAPVSQTIPANTQTPLVFDTTISDTDNIKGTDGKTFTINSPGIYVINMTFAAVGIVSQLWAGIKVNSLVYVSANQPSFGMQTNVTAICKLNKGDYINGSVWAAGTITTIASNGTSENAVPRISIVKISD